jgi:hypothetical protein
MSKDNFTNQQPFIVTAEHLKLPWGGFKDGRRFGCAFCLTSFLEGQTVRWICMPKVPNIFVCQEHDTPDVQELWSDRWTNVILPILRRWSSDYD